MKIQIGRALPLVLLLTLLSATQAQTVTYTFEHFAAPFSGPFTNVAPEIGSSSFRTSFVSAQSAIYAVGSLGAVTGNALVTSVATLQVTLSAAVDSVTLAFEARGRNFTLMFSSAAGATTATSSPTGWPGAKTGTLTFSSTNPFTSFTLATTTANWGIDNLTFHLAPPMRPAPVSVPDTGTTLLFFGFASGALLLLRRRLLAS